MSSEDLVRTICDLPRDRRHVTWYERLSEADRKLTDEVLQNVITQQIAPQPVARELRRHISTRVTTATIAKWMRNHVRQA